MDGQVDGVWTDGRMSCCSLDARRVLASPRDYGDTLEDVAMSAVVQPRCPFSLWQIVLHFSEWTLDRFTPSLAWIWLVGQMDGRCHRAFGQSLSSVFCFVPNYCGYPWGCGVLGCCSAFVVSAASAKVSTYCSEWTLGRSFRAIYQ